MAILKRKYANYIGYKCLAYLSISNKNHYFYCVKIQASIPPSENTIFNSLTLFKEDLNGILVTAYEQEPINNQLWEQNGSGDFDFGYTLIITDDLID